MCEVICIQTAGVMEIPLRHCIMGRISLKIGNDTLPGTIENPAVMTEWK